jgi:ubiquitin-protein ligase
MTRPVPKRLQKEIEHAKTLNTQGIFYEYNEMNMMMGKAMIVGPEGTPYEGCLLCFSIEYPYDYPFSSPALQIITSDGATRFHPNLYINGKVCLSILGTWSGPKWCAVMTISTVLSSIQSLLEPNPIVNEPGWEKYTLEHDKAKHYRDYVQHALIYHTLFKLSDFTRKNVPYEMIPFQDILKERLDDIMNGVSEIIEEGIEKGEVTYSSVIYNMSGKTKWSVLKGMYSEIQELRQVP